MSFNYNWTLKDANFTKDKGKVFSCFACGGGSTMGYKLAGFDVIGCNEIDPKMNKVYVENHKPRFNFLEPIQEFKSREDLPEELFDLDILDGSPPCSSFSTAGNREKDWGKKKKFKEGQSEQVLDTLFFDFLDLAERLQPKIIIAENVKGMLLGKAQKYVNEVLQRFDEIGYFVDYKLLDASKMGVPQKRERVFFYAIRKDLYNGPFEDLFLTRPVLYLEFKENPIKFIEVREPGNFENKLSNFYKELWDQRVLSDTDFSDINGRVRNKPNTGFGTSFAKENKVCGTLTAKKDCYADFHDGRYLSTTEKIKISSFPSDYNFLDMEPSYIMGMSVPPVMVAQIASRIYEQWLKVI
ncbi:MAG: DNA (cytosine-5-)-methyltransferase [Colwellia sp.]|nr:DNA (cytosine-5-)-methyltransferase [Colwellia sp.]